MTHRQMFAGPPRVKDWIKMSGSNAVNTWLVFMLQLHLVTACSNGCLAYATRPPPLEGLDEELECCMRWMRFALHFYFRVTILILIG
jgi:hypothetical protein